MVLGGVALGLVLAVLLAYLVLVAQFTSFLDPVLIILAVPTGLIGVLVTLALSGTTLNIQSLMGVVMLQGMVVSNSILIVDFANILRGLMPMALKLGAGSEAYAPLALAIIGCLASSIVLTVFVVPAAYLLIYERREATSVSMVSQEAQ